jgi:hypothetical protein
MKGIKATPTKIMENLRSNEYDLSDAIIAPVTLLSSAE